MKNLLLTFLLIISFTSTAIIAQEKTEDKSTPAPEKTEVNKAVPEANASAKAETKADPNKPMFGSKEHRSMVDEAPSKIESTENILFKTCMALAAVIGVILLLFSILKKVNGRLNNTGLENPMRIKNKLMIDSKNYIALVRVYEEELLVSVGPNGTSLLTRYALVEKEEAEGTDFENILNSEGKVVVPADLDGYSKGVDMKSIRELKNNDPS